MINYSSVHFFPQSRCAEQSHFESLELDILVHVVSTLKKLLSACVSTNPEPQTIPLTSHQHQQLTMVSDPEKQGSHKASSSVKRLGECSLNNT